MISKKRKVVIHQKKISNPRITHFNDNSKFIYDLGKPYELIKTMEIKIL